MRLGGTFVGAILGMLCWYIGEKHDMLQPSWSLRREFDQVLAMELAIGMDWLL